MRFTVGLTSGDLLHFHGEEAKMVYEAIHSAGAMGAGWAFIKLTNTEYHFVLANLTYFKFERQEL